MSITSTIKPGLNVNIIFTQDLDKEIVDVRASVIYDVTGKDITLSQTSPPCMQRHIGKYVSVTYLIKEKENTARHGFEGIVEKVIKEYSLASSNVVSAILVKKHSGIKIYDLRMSYRVRPKSDDTSLTLDVATQKVNILDISMAGVMCCRKSGHLTEAGKILKINLFIEGQSFEMDGKTIRAWFPSNAGVQSDLEYVRLQFLDMDRQCGRLLSEKLFAIQREILSADR